MTRRQHRFLTCMQHSKQPDQAMLQANAQMSPRKKSIALEDAATHTVLSSLHLLVTFVL